MTEFQLFIAAEFIGMAVLWTAALAAHVYESRDRGNNGRFALSVFTTMTAASFTVLGIIQILFQLAQI